MEIVPSHRVSTTNERLCLSNFWGFYLLCLAVSIIPTRHILGVVPYKIPVQGCTVYIEYKSVCTRKLSLGTKTYLWSHSVKQIEYGFPCNKGKQNRSWRVERLPAKICWDLLLSNIPDCIKQVSLLSKKHIFYVFYSQKHIFYKGETHRVQLIDLSMCHGKCRLEIQSTQEIKQ